MSVGLIIEIFILRNISEVSAFAFLEIELKKKTPGSYFSVGGALSSLLGSFLLCIDI